MAKPTGNTAALYLQPFTRTFRLSVCFLVLISLFVFSISGVHAGALSDTGQTTCYDGTGAVVACPAAGSPLAQDGSYNGSQPHFVDNGDETVSDLNTELTWQKADDGTTRTWTDAGTYCDGLELAGKSDWRLPTVEELGLLVDAEAVSPACFSAFTCKNDFYWASTGFFGDADSAWGVYFNSGGIDGRLKALSMYARCVRDGL